MDNVKSFYYGGLLVEVIAMAVLVRYDIGVWGLSLLALLIIGAGSSFASGVLLLSQNRRDWPYVFFSIVLFGICIWPKF